MDPFTALAAVTSAVNLVKKAASTIDDVRSLGPVLGKYFDAKSEAVKVLEEAKTNGGFKGSNMGKAIELELAIENARAFEEQVKGLFFPNNMDVWDKIVARRAQMDADDKAQRRKAAVAAKKRKQDFDEMAELCAVIVASLILVGLLVWVSYELFQYCQVNRCSNR